MVRSLTRWVSVGFLHGAAELAIDRSLIALAAIALHTTRTDTLAMELVMLGLHD
jgi:hypothetical protein